MVYVGIFDNEKPSISGPVRAYQRDAVIWVCQFTIVRGMTSCRVSGGAYGAIGGGARAGVDFRQ